MILLTTTVRTSRPNAPEDTTACDVVSAGAVTVGKVSISDNNFFTGCPVNDRLRDIPTT